MMLIKLNITTFHAKLAILTGYVSGVRKGAIQVMMCLFIYLITDQHGPAAFVSKRVFARSITVKIKKRRRNNCRKFSLETNIFIFNKHKPNNV